MYIFIVRLRRDKEKKNYLSNNTLRRTEVERKRKGKKE
jgi:hypothetical protein